MGISPLLFYAACSYYFPVAEIKEIALPDAQHAYQLNTNDVVQELNVSTEKLRYWTDKHCIYIEAEYYEPEDTIEKDVEQERKELPSRFFIPLVLSIQKDQIWLGRTKIEVPDWQNQDAQRERIEDLQRKTEERIDRYRGFVSRCVQQYKVIDTQRLLIAVDQEVSQYQLYRVLYSLVRQGSVEFAFLVNDTDPSMSRESAHISGIMGNITEEELNRCGLMCLEEDLPVHTTVLRQNAGQFTWSTFQGEERQASMEAGLPQYLGEEYPPKAMLELAFSDTVGSIFQAHDALAGAEVFCTDWRVGERKKAAEGSSSSLVSSRKTIKLGRDHKISVHLLELPYNVGYVHRRGDGVLCSGVLKLQEEERAEEIDLSGSLDLFKSSLLSDPVFDNLNLLREKNK